MRPMLATPGDAAGPQDLPRGPQWAHEIKWDGVRLLADVREGEVVLRTRSQRDVSAGFPELAQLADLADDVLLDGEAVAFVEGEPSFAHVVHRVHAGTGQRNRAASQTAARAHPVTFVAFDLLRLDGLDLTSLPWTHRRAALQDLWGPGRSRTLSPIHADAASLWSATRTEGLEGVVSKRRSSVYQPGTRSPDWLKYPHRATESYVVGGWRPEVGSTRLGAVLVGLPTARPPGGLVYRGRVGSGLAGRAGDALAEAIADRPSAVCPFTSEVPAADAHGTTWLRPGLVIDVRSLGLTAGGRLRQPSFVRSRPDLGAVEVEDG